MQHSMSNDTTIAGTVGGTLLTILTMPVQSIFHTIGYATIAATTSFFVSLILKEAYYYIAKKYFKRNKNG